jgi:hypothetical protein
VTEHDHTTIVPGCYRCDLNKDEVRDGATDTIKEALREYVGDGDGADEAVLAQHNAKIRSEALHEAAMFVDAQRYEDNAGDLRQVRDRLHSLAEEEA